MVSLEFLEFAALTIVRNSHIMYKKQEAELCYFVPIEEKK